MDDNTTEYVVPKLPPEAIPSFVMTAEDIERWELCHATAEAMSRQNEPSGQPNAQFVWQTTRWLYHSPIPLGDPDEEPTTTRDEFEAQWQEIFGEPPQLEA